MPSFQHNPNEKTASDTRASHDTVNPPNLISFMLKNWKKPSGKLPSLIKNAANFKKRRELLSKKFPGELLLIPAGHLKLRAGDQFYPFRPNSDFYYLTGNMEPDCVLALVPQKSGHREILFVEPNPGKSDATFFTDRVKGELWEGARLGVPESRARYGLETAQPLSELSVFLKQKAGLAPKGFRTLSDVSSSLEESLNEFAAADQAEKNQFLATTLSEMRLIKDSYEIQALAEAVEATQRGFEDVIERLKTAKSERELEGVFFTRARMEGNDVGYGSIVASGAHACTLHWKRNDGVLKAGDLLLLDAGIEGRSLYTADVTRTFPISGKFSPEQKEIYQIVLQAQRAALREVKPGNDFLDPNRAAMKVLAQGLEQLGILPTSAEEALKDENQFYKRYSLHNVSHMLGLDVHDCAQARLENYKYGKLEVGMVLTIEPGLYFQLDDLTVPAKYRGIGIRLEDDVVVTKKGHRNLSAGIPTEIKDVEAWMKGIWKRR